MLWTEHRFLWQCKQDEDAGSQQHGWLYRVIRWDGSTLNSTQVLESVQLKPLNSKHYSSVLSHFVISGKQELCETLQRLRQHFGSSSYNDLFDSTYAISCWFWLNKYQINEMRVELQATTLQCKHICYDQIQTAFGNWGFNFKHRETSVSATNSLLRVDVLVFFLSKLWHESLFHFHEWALYHHMRIWLLWGLKRFKMYPDFRQCLLKSWGDPVLLTRC